MKKVLLFLLIFSMIIANLSFSYAEDGDSIADADFNGGKMHWNISSQGVLKITGSGDMPNYSSSVNAPWYSYRSQIDSVIVDDGITSIGDYSFYQLTKMTTISLPSSVSKLGIYCFAHCEKLRNISIPENVDTIPYYCFYDCYSLERVQMPTTLSAIRSYAFCYCSKLSSIVIPDGVATLNEDGIFEYCTSLKEITLPKTLTSIGYGRWAFNSTNIQSVFYNGTIQQWLSIDFNSFSLPMMDGCKLYCDGERIDNLIIPSGVTSIPSNAFRYVNINSVSIPDGVNSIGAYAFYYSTVSNVFISDSITSVGDNAFANCSSLNRVYYLGDSSKWNSIAWNTGNDNIIDASRVFVSSMDEILDLSVEQVANGIITVSAPKCIAGDEITITAIPDLGFKLKKIFVNGIEILGSSFITQANTDYVVTAEFEYYMDVIDHGTCGTTLEWFLFENSELVINGTGSMSNYNTYSNYTPWYNYRKQIKKVSINDGVTTIGTSAFYAFTSLTEVVFPESLITIGESAFSGCTSLTEVVFPESLITIGVHAFECCSLLSVVTLPQGLESINSWAFDSCRRLTSVYFTGELVDWLNVVHANSSIFYYAHEFYISDSLVSGELVIPDGVEEIAAYSFSYYDALDHIIIPGSVTSVGTSAFYGCGLNYVEFEGDAPTLESSEAFGSGKSINGTVIYYHQNATGWSSPQWNGYYASIIEEPSDYSILDDYNKNSQGVLFTLNNTSKTATVGDGSSTNNNSGYFGSQKGAVVIPDVVKKNNIEYKVIGIGQYAFSSNNKIKSVTIGKNVSSIIPSSLINCANLSQIIVDGGNEFYSSKDGVLYDIEQLYLYVYPSGKIDENFSVPTTVKTIGSYSFYNNKSMKNLYVGANITAIYSSAFYLPKLESITLPFIGKQLNDGARFNSVFYDYSSIPKNVVVLDGGLTLESFVYCSSIVSLVLPITPVTVPDYCFYGCTQLECITFSDTGYSCEIGELKLPEGIKSIENYAFSGCNAITVVSIPKSLTSIASTSFSNSGVTKFIVADGSTSYSTDSWGVLYSANKKTLVLYPSCRPWPYYNVLDGTQTINYSAFSNCSNLINLYIPNSVSSLSSSISNCPNMVLCCYMNSAAYQYSFYSGITSWYMDNKTLQGINIYSLPENNVQIQGQINLDGLYVVGNYSGKELQIDNYTLDYDSSTSGEKTVTVSYLGKTVTFKMMFIKSDQGNVIKFTCSQEYDGEELYIALYSNFGEMLISDTATIVDGEALIYVNDQVYNNADSARLFILESESYKPIENIVEKSI